MNRTTQSAATNTSETSINESILSVDSKGIITFHPGDKLPLRIRVNNDWHKLKPFITSLDKSLKKITEQNDSSNTPELIFPRIGAESSGHSYLEADLKPKFTKWLANQQHVPFRAVQRTMQEIYEDLCGYRRHAIDIFEAHVVYATGHMKLSCPEKCLLRPNPFVHANKGYKVKSEKVHNGIELLTLFTGLIKMQQIAGEVF